MKTLADSFLYLGSPQKFHNALSQYLQFSKLTSYAHKSFICGPFKGYIFSTRISQLKSKWSDPRKPLTQVYCRCISDSISNLLNHCCTSVELPYRPRSTMGIPRQHLIGLHKCVQYQSQTSNSSPVIILKPRIMESQTYGYTENS